MIKHQQFNFYGIYIFFFFVTLSCMTKAHNTPWAYFLTFRTYGTFLHGDARESVDKNHNIYGSRKIPFKPHLQNAMKTLCGESEFILSSEMRKIILASFQKTTVHFNWRLIAAHVRSNHAHLVIQSNIDKEKTMTKLKAYATQALKAEFPALCKRQKFWSTHGSTKLIWSEEQVFPVMHYIIAEQGDPMALYYDKKLYDSFDPALYELLKGE